MKTKKQNINIRELFRDKMEYAEAIPDASVKLKLMRRVAKREFLRFNVARFNIYYAGGILISGIVTALLLVPSLGISGRLTHPANPFKLEGSDTNNYIEVPVEEPFRIKSDRSDAIHYESIRKNILHKNPDKPEQGILKSPDTDKRSTPVMTGINSPFSKTEFFSEFKADNHKLKSGYKPDALLIETDASAGCAPMKVRFHYKSSSGDSCRWTFGDGGYSYKKDPEWIFDVEGEYNVVLDVYTNEGNHLSSFAKITVHPRPRAHFEIAPEKAVIPDDEIRFLNYSINAVKYSWEFGDGTASESFEPRHAYSKYANYNVRLVVYSDWGCSDSLTVLNAFSGSGYFISFPNAFIPNAQGPSGGFYSSKSDEAAQVFHPSYTGVSDYQLKIFSKLGILIFESNDINLGWDGYNKGQLCDPGVYIWKVRGKFRNGEPFIKMGDVTLLKN